MYTAEKEKKLRELQEAAVEACIAHYTKHGGYNRMCEAIKAYFGEEIGYKGNKEIVIAHREIASYEITIKCISSLSREQMAQLDDVIKEICQYPPIQERHKGLFM